MKVRGIKLPQFLSAALLVGSLLIAACGGDDDDSSADETPGTAAATREMDTPEAGETVEPSATQSADNGTDGESSAAAVDACSLLTASEVERVLEVPVEAQPEDLPPIYSCRWVGQGTEGLTQVSMSVYVAASNDEARAYYETTSATEGSEPVEGLGDEAYWTSAPFNSLEVLDGHYDLSVSVVYSGDDSKGLSEKLANAALKRLP